MQFPTIRNSIISPNRYRGMIRQVPMSFLRIFPMYTGLWSRCPITWECSGSWSKKSDDDIISVGFMVGSITITFFSRLEVIAWSRSLILIW